MDINRKALLIGNWKYSDKRIENLKSPKKDIEEMKAFLENTKGGNFDVQTLKNPAFEETLIQIKRFFESNSGSDKTLFLYFSGHADKDVMNNVLYFYSKNTDPLNRESSTISSKDINDMINRSEGARIIFIIDSCFGHRQRETLQVFNADFIISGTDIALLSSAREFVNTTEKNNKSTSTFTGHLLDSINSGNEDINDMYLYCFDKMKDLQPIQNPVRRIISTGTITLNNRDKIVHEIITQEPRKIRNDSSQSFTQVTDGWDEIIENDLYSFFVLYIELDFVNDQYKVDQLWNDNIEKYLCSHELESNSSWKIYCGNDMSKKRIYAAPVRKDNMPIVRSIFQTFLNKQVDDIRLNKIDIKNKYYLTAMNLNFKNQDSSARLDPSCSNIYKMADHLESDKLYFSKEVIELLPENINRNLKHIKHKSDIFTYTFDLLT